MHRCSDNISRCSDKISRCPDYLSLCADYTTKMLLQLMQPINIFIYLTCLEVFQVNGQCVNQLGVVKNGQTCVQLNPGECYDVTILKNCCQSCTTISTGVTGCEYGDKVANCNDVLCPFYTDPNECCATCKFTTTATTPSPPVTTITKTATIATTIKTPTRQATIATITRTSAPHPTITTTKTATSLSTIATTKTTTSQPTIAITKTTSQSTIATTKTTTSHSPIAITIKKPIPRPAIATTTKRATTQSTIAKATIKRATLLSTTTKIKETASKVSSATSSLQLALIRPFVRSLQPYLFMSSSLVIIGLHFAIKFTIDYE